MTANGGIEERLADRLVRESATSEIAHGVLVIAAGALAWPDAPHELVIGWVIAVAAAAIARGILRTSAMRRHADAAASRRAIRIGVVFIGLAWSGGLLLIGPRIPLDSLAFIIVILAGVVSGAMSSLLADPPAFFLLLALLLVPLSATILLHGTTRTHYIGAVIVVGYGGAMAVYFRRAHATLLAQLHAALDLEVAAAAVLAANDAQRTLVRIMEETTDHVGISNADGTLRFINRDGRLLIGLAADEPLDGLQVRSIVPPRLHEWMDTEVVPAVLRDGRWAGESSLLHRDGREIPVSLVVIAHRDANGTLESTSTIARDMTREIAVRTALQDARTEAEQATLAKSAFLANTSHEVRTPLNGILGMVELLLDTELDFEQRRSAELIATSGESLLTTINDLLDLSKIDAGQLDLEEIPFDLHHTIHSCVRLMMSRAHGKGIDLVSEVERAVPQRVIGDSHRLLQVLSNLVGNAVKFTSVGDVVVSARLALGDDTHAHVRISVKDSGIGIAAADQQRIFEPFSQADRSTTRNFGGTGLGLAIARKIVALMGGSLEVTSAPGVGSEFSFTIAFAMASEAPAKARAVAARLATVRALVVDDHPVNRRVTSEALSWAGCAEEAVTSAVDALSTLRAAAAKRAPFNLIVSDVQMPVHDGFWLAAEVRDDPELRDTRIILLTSAGQKGDGQRCRDLGVAGYMQKPVSRVELIEAVVTALDQVTTGEAPSGGGLVTRHSIDEARRKLHVLIAEDNPVNQMVAAAMLEKRGHRVEIAHNGREAVNAVARDSSFDVVLMDVQMPVLDGIAATSEIRASGNDLRIMALTASVSNGERERCMAAGMNGYVSKPFKSHQLFAAIEGWIEDVATSDAAPTASRE